jgi:hypothetical protein
MTTDSRSPLQSPAHPLTGDATPKLLGFALTGRGIAFAWGCGIIRVEEDYLMVRLFVAGNPVGTLADAEKIIAEVIARNQPIEFRDDSGELVGTFTPRQPSLPTEPLVPWDPSITQEELDRRASEPGFSIEEVRKRLGWA